MNTSELLKSLANEAKELSNETKRKTNNTHEITLINYPDIIITKTMKSQKKHLVILFSSGTAFVKTENEKRKCLTGLSLQSKFVMEKLPRRKEQETKICLRLKKMSWTVGLSR